MRIGLLTPSLAVIALLVALGASAYAASPGFKLLATTGPTHLPPRQSETQRVTVEAEGGTYTLAGKAVGRGTPVVAEARLSYTAGDPVATIEDVEADASFEVGARITGSGLPLFGSEAIVVSCSTDCKTVGSTITLSVSPEESATNEAVSVFTKRMAGVTGVFQVGDEVQGVPWDYFPSNTVVEAVGPGTLMLSKATSFEYSPFEGAIDIATPSETTTPLAFDAPASSVQAALEALPVFGSGSVTVSGGPGGSAATPLFVAFGGRFANENVSQVEVDASGLTGAHPDARVFTVVPGGPGTGEIAVFPINVGGAPTNGELMTIQVGPLPPGIVTAGPARNPKENELEAWTCLGGAGESMVECTSTSQINGLSPVGSIVMPIEIDQPSAGSATVPVSIEGGGAAPASYSLPIVVSKQPAPSGVQAFWAGAFDADGNPETQAGAHPYSAQTFFELNTVRGTTGKIVPAGDPKEVKVDLPPGFLGNPLVTKRCPQALVAELANGEGSPEAPACNGAEMSVGRIKPALGNFGTEPAGGESRIFNDVPPQGYAAEFTGLIGAPLQSLLGSVRASGDGGVTIVAPNVANFNKIYGTYAALEGSPPAAQGKAFLDNPTACAQQREESVQGRGPWTSIEASSWQSPFDFSRVLDPLPLLTNCQPLTEAWVGNGPDPANEKPSFAFEPGTDAGSSPTGATARLHIPQPGLTDPGKLVTSHLKKTVVKLPQGLIVNPSAANGLQSCSESQIGLLGTNFPSPSPIRFNEEAPSCPDGSKLGTFEVSSPLLEEKVGGTIYLAAQEENPFDSLLALYLVIESPRFGLTVKLAGEVTPDPSKDGQLTATFDNNPQLPFEDLVLHFRGGGPRSQLATPEVCGHYGTAGSLTPWSAEAGEAALTADAGFSVSRNCSSSPGSRPFSPSIEAGTTDPKAGDHSSMVIKVNRKDGEQELDRLDFTLPLGVVGKLAGIPYCPESTIADANRKSGKSELANPSCPSASQLGTVDTAAGVGSEPVHVGGRVYLAGPYKGAPISTVVVTPAVAGPFDLGTVVIRAPAFVDLETAQITVKSDPVPTMLRGLPLKLRSVVINVDRPGFILNPTNCEPQTFRSSLHSSNGATATPSSRFQVGGCGRLKFRPKLKISLSGATRRSGHPALKAVVSYPKKGAYSNIARAQVGLPHSLFLDQGNLDKVCTQPELKSATCPKRAIYGRARAWTPLLDKPLEGPVYLGVGYGHQLPDLVADLNGQVRILLHGKVDTTKHDGLRNTFEVVPDAPVSKFVLEMKGGKKYGLLENSENLCRKKQKASALFQAQNGLSRHLRPVIASDCS